MKYNRSKVEMFQRVLRAPNKGIDYDVYLQQQCGKGESHWEDVVGIGYWIAMLQDYS